MKHYLDLTTDQLRALYIVIPHEQPFVCLQETIEKIERLLEIAKATEKANGITDQAWGEDAFIE
tara:strand:+ start:530 stop:721 length:192 start_codon:yes stop_codon:yes gene_type:complete